MVNRLKMDGNMFELSDSSELAAAMNLVDIEFYMPLISEETAQSAYNRSEYMQIYESRNLVRDNISDAGQNVILIKDCNIGREKGAACFHREFDNMKFQNCTFSGIKFENVDFTDCDMRTTTFNDCEFKNCKFEFKSLEHVRFNNTKFDKVDFSKVESSRDIKIATDCSFRRCSGQEKFISNGLDSPRR